MRGFLDGMAQRALIVAPHADDEALGAGGFMAKAASFGWEVTVLFTTISGYASLARGDVSVTESRLQEAERSLETLGAAGYRVQFLGDEHHLRLDAVPQADLIRFVEGAVVEASPSVVVVPTLHHYNQDHRAVAQACWAALRPAPSASLPFVPVVLAYPHAGVAWGEGGGFRGSFHVEITGQIDQKLAALACYKSQLCPLPHPRSLEMVRAWCSSMGAYAGVAYAESYECLRFAL